MNIVFGIVCIIISTYLGYYLSKKYVKRRDFYYCFNNFNKDLKVQVGFSKNSIKKIYENIKEKDNDFYKKMGTYFNSNNENCDLRYLRAEENKYLDLYFNSITNIDDKTLLKFIETNEKKIIDCYENAVNDEKKYRSLYIKIGFIVGLIAMVILL